MQSYFQPWLRQGSLDLSHVSTLRCFRQFKESHWIKVTMCHGWSDHDLRVWWFFFSPFPKPLHLTSVAMHPAFQLCLWQWMTIFLYFVLLWTSSRQSFHSTVFSIMTMYKLPEFMWPQGGHGDVLEIQLFHHVHRELPALHRCQDS